MFKRHLNRKLKFKREIVKLEDGGTVCIDWADHKKVKKLPENAPILVFLHSLFGSSREFHGFIKEATNRGYRCCVFTRRGHGGLKLTTPEFNVFGNIKDVDELMKRIIGHYPKSWIGFIGLSMGY